MNPDSFTPEDIKTVVEALDTYERPESMMVSKGSNAQLSSFVAHYIKWYEDLFSPKGLGMLFPNLVKDKE